MAELEEPPYETEEEYWTLFNEWEKRLTKLITDLRKMFKKPKEYMNEFDNIMNEGVEKRLVTKEFAEQKKMDLINGISNPRMKQKVINSLKKHEPKIIKKLKENRKQNKKKSK